MDFLIFLWCLFWFTITTRREHFARPQGVQGFRKSLRWRSDTCSRQQEETYEWLHMLSWHSCQLKFCPFFVAVINRNIFKITEISIDYSLLGQHAPICDKQVRTVSLSTTQRNNLCFFACRRVAHFRQRFIFWSVTRSTQVDLRASRITFSVSRRLGDRVSRWGNRVCRYR